MRALKITLDCDGVLYPFVDALRDSIVERTGIPAATMPAPRTWGFWGEWGMTKDEWTHHFRQSILTHDLFGRADPIPGAVDGFRALVDAGHRVTVVTDRDLFNLTDRVWDQMMGWWDRNGLPRVPIIMSADKTIVPADLAIDDAPHHVEVLTGAGVRAVLFDQSWNRSSGGLRACGWDGVARAVQDFLTET